MKRIITTSILALSMIAITITIQSLQNAYAQSCLEDIFGTNDCEEAIGLLEEDTGILVTDRATCSKDLRDFFKTSFQEDFPSLNLERFVNCNLTLICNCLQQSGCL